MNTRLLLPAILLCSGINLAAQRPNIVCVFIDDMGYSDVGCFAGEAKTPCLDRMAAEGIRFTQFYVNMPICSPSRCALLTGQYPQRWKVTSYLAARKENNQRGMAQWLDPKAPSIARALQSSGYATGHFGKWHLGGQRDVGEAPLISEYGFDESLTNFEGLGDRVLPIMGGVDGRPAKKNGLGVGSEKLGRGKIEWAPRHEVTERFVRRGITFIKKAQEAKKPFFINLWPDDVHSPYSPPAGKAGTGSKRDLYIGVLENMDAQLGVLFDYIRDSETLRTNTVVMIASDNGYEPGAGTAKGFRGFKGLLYEGGIRSPLIMWAPGYQPLNTRGSKNETAIFSSMDINRSLYSIAGISVPAETKLDGEDVKAALLGTAATGRAAPIFWKRPPDRKESFGERNADLAVRDGQWKLLVDLDGTNVQLYNLATDSAEANNLATAQPNIAARLVKLVMDWNTSIP